MKRKKRQETILRAEDLDVATRGTSFQPSKLLLRQIEVRKLLASGSSTKEIALQLGLNVTTVRTYKTKLLSRNQSGRDNQSDNSLSGLEKFSHLEAKISRTIELTKTLRQEKESLEKEMRGEAAGKISLEPQRFEKQTEPLIRERDIRRPPMNAEYLLYLLLRKEEREAVIGDLIECYNRMLRRFDKHRADLWFYKQVVGSVFPLLRRSLLRIGALVWLGRILRRLIS